MKEFVYDNAVIQISIPNEEQVANIRKATKVFLNKIVKEDIFLNGYGNKTRAVKETQILDTKA